MPTIYNNFKRRGLPFVFVTSSLLLSVLELAFVNWILKPFVVKD